MDEVKPTPKPASKPAPKKVTMKQVENGLRKLKTEVDALSSKLSVVSDVAGAKANQDIVYQDIVHLEKAFTALTDKVELMNRLMKYDERTAAVGEQQSRTELVGVVANNSRLLERYLKTKEDAESLEPPYKLERNRHQIRLRAKLTRARKLEKLQQETTEEPCPCGKGHYAINFLDKKEVVYTLCPAEWWWMLSQIALEDGRLTSFCNTTPMKEFVSLYAI